MVGAALISTERGGGQADLEELRGEAARLVALVTVVVAVLLLMRASLSPEPGVWAGFSVALGLLGFGSFRWSSQNADRAAGGLACGLLAVAAVAAVLYPSLHLATLLGPAVLVFGVVVGWRSAVGSALGASCLILLQTWLLDGLSMESASLPLAMVWLCAGLAWLALRPLHIALQWSWSSYVEARQKADEARTHRQTLAEALKSLDAAYSRLAAANRELTRARRAAEEARRAKAEFAATISHELRTPLNLIVGFSEMMVLAPHSYADEPLPGVYRGDMEAVYRNAMHVLSLVDDVLDLSQIEAHRMPLRRRRVPIAQIVEESAATVTSLLRDKKLNLVVEVPPDLPPVWVDPARVRQVVINLLSNAARCTDEGGICVGAALGSNEIVVSVTDTGVGIRPDELSEVFEEFRQVGDPHSRRSGSGLGLTICRRFVEMHGGTIWAESQPDVGSTFRFTLPLCEQVVASPYQPDPGRLAPLWGPGQADRAIAVVDDDPAAVRVFERYLDGYHVITAGTGLPTDSSTAPPAALIVTRQTASSPAAWSSSSWLAGGVPVVFCPLSTTTGLAQELGVSEYMVKPITSEQLRSALGRVGRPYHSVLVVDDDPEMLRLITRMVRAIASVRRVLTASGGAEALRVLLEDRPDLVVLDLLMPEVDGYQVLEAMRRDVVLRDIPVVVVSAKGREEESVTASKVEVTRPGGLTVGEAMRCLKGVLDALLAASSPGTAPEPRASPAQ
ncbi:MAG: response regulator [Chloroflexi bacterium]|nr:response regulator [Chloroflexota bacterium]